MTLTLNFLFNNVRDYLINTVKYIRVRQVIPKFNYNAKTLLIFHLYNRVLSRMKTAETGIVDLTLLIYCPELILAKIKIVKIEVHRRPTTGFHPKPKSQLGYAWFHYRK